MRSEKLFEVLGDINEEAVKASEDHVPAKKGRMTYLVPALCAAAAILVIIAAGIGIRGFITRDSGETGGASIADTGEENEDLTGGETPGDGEEVNVPGQGSGEDDPGQSGEEDRPGQVISADWDHGTDPLEALDNWEVCSENGLSSVRTIYPRAYGEGLSTMDFYMGDAYLEWFNDIGAKQQISNAYRGEMNDYCLSAMEAILASDTENTVCSPLNTFIAFAMIAEVSDGNTRQQVLDMLGVSDIQTLRDMVRSIWESNYVDIPNLKSLLANSIWMNDSYSYNEDTLKLLAGYYYASSYYGNPDDPAMEEALKNWINDNTDGLLEESVNNLNIDKNLVFALVSTINYKAMWHDEFNAGLNTTETFHGVKGDTDVTMMHRNEFETVCRTDRFTSVSLSTQDSGEMFFYLPAEGVDVNDLLSDPDALNWATGTYDLSWSDDGIIFSPLVNMSIPKFRVSGETDLIEMMRSLGMTDALDPALSDFTPLTEDAGSLYLQSATHSAMVEIDEQGITGVAFTDLPFAAGGPDPEDEIDFVLDRPFLFVVTGGDGSILFSGVVRNIE